MKQHRSTFFNQSLVTLAVVLTGSVALSGTVARMAHAEPWQTNVKNVKVTLTKTHLTFVESGKTTAVTADGIVFLKKGSRLSLRGRDDTPGRYRLLGKYHVITPEGDEYDGSDADLHVTELTQKDGTKRNMGVIFPVGKMHISYAPDATGKKHPDAVSDGSPNRTVCLTFYLVP